MNKIEGKIVGLRVEGVFDLPLVAGVRRSTRATSYETIPGSINRAAESNAAFQATAQQ